MQVYVKLPELTIHTNRSARQFLNGEQQVADCPHKALQLGVTKVFEVKSYECVISICFLQKINLQLFCKKMFCLLCEWFVFYKRQPEWLGGK